MSPHLSDKTPLLELDIPARMSKKRYIYEMLLQRIQDQSLPKGTRLPNASALASQWQVSYVTAHAALNELTRGGWLVRTPKGTFVSAPAEPEAVVKARTAILALPPREDILKGGSEREVFEILQGISNGDGAAKTQLRIQTLPSYPAAEEADAAFHAVQGGHTAIFIGTQYRELIKRLADIGHYTVTLISDPGCGTAITYDRALSVELGVRELISKGRTKIGFLGSIDDAKFETFEAVLQQAGLSVHHKKSGNYVRFWDAAQGIKKLASVAKQLDAVFAVNHAVATSFVQEVRILGLRVPDDLAVVAMGIEGTVIPELPLTYVKVPYASIGDLAMQITAEQLGDSKAKRRIITLKPQLIPGASV